ncbi:hypothetical protein B7486_14100 [cyanobacterium TDX16]|nr:hypothetical protein B7486_14100 [cyanobacterium TDX16]
MDNQARPTAEQNAANSSLSDHLTLWSLIIPAIIYASGFLIVQQFHDSYGLRGIDTDFFKIRYAHVGLIFLAGPLIVGTATFALFLWKSETKISPANESAFNEHQSIQLRVWARWWWSAMNASRFNPKTIVAGFFFTANFYLALLFVAPGEKGSGYYQLFFAFLIACTAIFVMWIVRRTGNESKIWVNVFQLICTILLAAICFCLLYTQRNELKSLYWPSGLVYFGFSSFLGFSAWRLWARKHEENLGILKPVRRTLGIVAVCLVYYYCLNYYADYVFPFIPAGKGGGDYSDAAIVTVEFTDSGPQELPDALKLNNLEKKLILLDSNGDFLFFANPFQPIGGSDPDRSGPPIWRLSPSKLEKPFVLQVPRDGVRSVIHSSETFRSRLRRLRDSKEKSNIGQSQNLDTESHLSQTGS